MQEVRGWRQRGRQCGRGWGRQGGPPHVRLDAGGQRVEAERTAVWARLGTTRWASS